MDNPLFEMDMQPSRPLDRSEIFPEDYHHPGYVPGMDDWQTYCRINNLNPDNGKLRSGALDGLALQAARERMADLIIAALDAE